MRRRNNARRAELAKIHIAKKELGLDEDTYRDILWAVCRARSAAELDRAGRARLLNHFRYLGWTPGISRAKSSGSAKDRKIWSLWYQLRDAGLIRYASARALRAEVRKLTGCDDLKFCTEAQKSHVIECLKKWLERADK